MTYILDACALIAYIKEEHGEGFEAVEALFNRVWLGIDRLSISAVNLVEVYYDFIRADGIEAADEVMREVERLPVTVIETIGGDMRRRLPASLKQFFQVYTRFRFTVLYISPHCHFSKLPVTPPV